MFFEGAKVRETLLFTMPNAPHGRSKKHEIRQGKKNDFLNIVCFPFAVGSFLEPKIEEFGPPFGVPKSFLAPKKLNC